MPIYKGSKTYDAISPHLILYTFESYQQKGATSCHAIQAKMRCNGTTMEGTRSAELVDAHGIDAIPESDPEGS